MSNNSNSNGSIRDIERGIEQDRNHFAETLSALENKFSPGQLVDQALGYAKKNSGDFSNNLVHTIANNPIPTILTGIGVAWMAVNQSRNNGGNSNQFSSSDNYYEPGSYVEGSSHSDSGGKLSGAKDKAGNLKGSAGEKAQGLKGSAGEKAQGLKGNMSNSAHQAGDRAHHMADSARHSAAGMTDRSRQQWERTAHSARSFFEENPLAVGAAAVAIGALIGASLPVSSREKELLGSTGEQAVDRAKSMATEAKQTATEAGKAGAQAAKDKAKQSKKAETSHH